ncbi:MAG: hypothetical protein Q7R99_00080 [bacterium]|nr:hypothetical protein [bacterium]
MKNKKIFVPLIFVPLILFCLVLLYFNILSNNASRVEIIAPAVGLSGVEIEEMRVLLEKNFLNKFVPFEKISVYQITPLGEIDGRTGHFDKFDASINFNTPFPFRGDEVAGFSWATLFAKNINTSKWEVIRKYICCGG